MEAIKASDRVGSSPSKDLRTNKKTIFNSKARSPMCPVGDLYKARL